MRRRSIILAGVFVVVSVIGYVAYDALRVDRDKYQLFVGCHSDKLYVIASAYASKRAESDDTVPSKAAVVDSLDSTSRDWLLTCFGARQPFVWNEHIGKLDPTGQRVPLVWCPDGSHGRHVGVVMLENGKVESVMMTREELSELLRRSGR